MKAEFSLSDKEKIRFILYLRENVEWSKTIMAELGAEAREQLQREIDALEYVTNWIEKSLFL